MKKILVALFITAALTLTGCTSSESEDGPPQYIESVEVTTPDGESVTCVITGSYRGGVTCNWDAVNQ